VLYQVDLVEEKMVSSMQQQLRYYNLMQSLQLKGHQKVVEIATINYKRKKE
jgi:hypothetical protein